MLTYDINAVVTVEFSENIVFVPSLLRIQQTNGHEERNKKLLTFFAVKRY